MRAHSIQDGEHLDTCWCHYEQGPASERAAVKEEHRKLYRSLLTEGDPEWRIQLLADFERDARVKEAEWFWANVDIRANDEGQRKAKERIAQLKRGEA